MSGGKLPRDLSGEDLLRALARIGFEFSRQRGSHMVLRRQTPTTTLVVPDHRPLKLGLLRNLIRQAGLTTDEFLQLLRDRPEAKPR